MIYSYTQISQYLACPRRYRHRYLEGWQEKDSRAAMLFGAIECALAELLTSSFQSVDELGSLFPARLLKDNPEQHEYGAH